MKNKLIICLLIICGQALLGSQQTSGSAAVNVSRGEHWAAQVPICVEWRPLPSDHVVARKAREGLALAYDKNKISIVGKLESGKITNVALSLVRNEWCFIYNEHYDASHDYADSYIHTKMQVKPLSDIVKIFKN